MTVFYSAELLNSALRANSPAYGSTLRRYRASITLAAQTTADTITIGSIPAGSVFLHGQLLSTISLGSSTIAIGIAGSTGKYRAAAVFTAVDTPTLFGTTAAALATLAANETQIITIATATLPGTGTLVVDMIWSCP